jgi:hypothetical protein
MIVIRYFFWTLVYHLVTFYKQKPLAFLIGCLLWPYHVISRIAHPPELHKEIVSNGIEALKSYWQIEGAVLPPAFVRKRFVALEREVRQ